MARAEWLPVERRRTHPADLSVVRGGLWCGAFFLCPLPTFLFTGNFESLVIRFLLALGTLLPLAAWGSSRLAQRRRDARVFAELGPGDADMVEVRADFYRETVFLGTDQGYAWPVEGTTSFQGERVAFRVGGPGWSARWRNVGLTDLLGPDGERVTLQWLRRGPGGAGELPIALGGAGPLTPPPLVCDPGMRPPALVGRVALLIAAVGIWIWVTWAIASSGGTALIGLFFGVPLFWGLTEILLLPLWRDRKGRRG